MNGNYVVIHEELLLSMSENKEPGGTQLSFWYRCAARRATNGGLKNGQARKIGA